ncbi:hypothetical protein [Bacillus thuringiensis]|uniref:hypothetical protein n=1 Tax=Bacillus thuringiensis TaxID=1428 RepID=UPI002175D7DE|nr:hypothetical protein [Bacillus thuringiensis]
MSAETWARKTAAAAAMRALSDNDRDALIAAAGRKVIDCRSRFAEMQKQADIARSYRAPVKPTGAA